MTNNPDNHLHTISAGYHSRIRKRLLILSALLFLLLLAVLLSLQIGSYQLQPILILQSLFGICDEPLTNHLIWKIRLPRTIAALLAGAALALAGNIMQTLLKNPLAAPSTLGVSQGAAFGAACAIILFNADQQLVDNYLLSGQNIIAICAFCGALASIIAIIIISTLRRLSSEALILAGVAMAAFFSACTMLLQYFATDTQVAASLFWTFGDPGKAGWYENLLIAIALLPAAIFAISSNWCFNSLQWGDEVAATLGVNVSCLRITGLLLACLLTAVVTAFLGIIAFVGLMAPHLIRPLVGSDHRFLLPSATICGALLLLLADIISRTITAPVVIPVGIITSFAGAPLFLFLLLQRRS